MTKVTLHRILGVLVLFGLFILLLPLLQTYQKPLMEEALAKSPPFPDQAVQITTATPSGSQQATADSAEESISLSSAWVVQVGSFKEKTQAQRLVDDLRTNGYRAFTQQVKTAFGDSTHVFIGPENKETSAYALASLLHAKMNIDGKVISYQPLAL